MELSKKQKLRVLKNALAYYEKANRAEEPRGLCGALREQIGVELGKPITTVPPITEYLPEFLRPSETLFRETWGIGYWWPVFCKKPRIEYLKKLITKIENQ